MEFTTDDLFADVPSPWPGELPDQELRVDLLSMALTSSLPEVADTALARALAELARSEFMAYGTGGGERLTDQQVSLVLRTLRRVLGRLGVTYNVGWRDFNSFRAYWTANGGHGSWNARRVMVTEAFDPILGRLDEIEGGSSQHAVARTALSALTDPAAIHDHLRRLERSIESDPRLAVSAAKDLVESTAKLILKQRGEKLSGRERLPSLIGRAQESLGLHPRNVDDASEEAASLRSILGSLQNLAQSVAELRNNVGVGHGREAIPTWVRPRHARLAASAATTWCNLMLETLADPHAPWRQNTPLGPGL